jgi:hypothetical protein
MPRGSLTGRSAAPGFVCDLPRHPGCTVQLPRPRLRRPKTLHHLPPSRGCAVRRVRRVLRHQRVRLSCLSHFISTYETIVGDECGQVSIPSPAALGDRHLGVPNSFGPCRETRAASQARVGPRPTAGECCADGPTVCFDDCNIQARPGERQVFGALQGRLPVSAGL